MTCGRPCPECAKAGRRARLEVALTILMAVIVVTLAVLIVLRGGFA